MTPLSADQTVAVDAQTARFLDRGPWLLLALLPIAALAFRRGWLMLLPLLVLAPAQRAAAMTWQDLWSRPDQQAQAALDAGEARQAQALARDPQLRAAAAYRAEDYAAAADDFANRDAADAHYNLGNALARQGKFKEALAAYDRALKQQPQMKDAIANRKAVEDWLKQQQKQEQKGQQGKGDKNEQHQSQAGDDKNPQQSQDDQQQRADQQNGQDQNGKDQGPQNRQSSEQDGKQQDEANDSAGESQAQRNSSAAKPNADNDKGNPGKIGAQPESKAAEQQAQQQFQQSMDQALQSGANKPQQPVRLGAREDGKPRDEKQQAVDQWLQRVPDDPGGLLRRKFQLEAQRRQGGDNGGEP